MRCSLEWYKDDVTNFVEDCSVCVFKEDGKNVEVRVDYFFSSEEKDI